jgi:hypothetical protein
MRFTIIVAAALAAASAMPAGAASLMLSGSGTIDNMVGRLPTTGIAPVGASTTIRFDVDPAASTLYEAGVDYAVYDLSVTNFTAAIGGYTFTPTGDPLFAPALTIDKGFSFFDGINSEASYVVGFYFSDVPSSAGQTNPFDVAAGSRGTLSIQALFKADEIGAWDLSLAQLPDLGRAASQSFAYVNRDVATGRSGQVRGRFSGQFGSSVAAVPEPGTWCLMLLGFALVGGAVRRSPRRTPALARA